MTVNERRLASWLAERLLDERATLDADCHAEGCEPFDGEPCEGCMDVRLQIHDGDASIHTGDPCYDTDHRGAWGSASLSKSDKPEHVLVTAEDLVSQAMDMLAEDLGEDGAESALAEILA